MKKIPEPGDPDYWEWRGRTGMRGKPKAFKNPEHLWHVACQYFDRITKNPFYKEDFVRGGDEAGTIVKLKTIRPFTWAGLEDFCNEKGYLNCLEDYQRNKDNRYTEYASVIRAIDKTMRTQKFEGAAVGAFNANIISRDLGLIDKSEQRVENITVTLPDIEANE